MKTGTLRLPFRSGLPIADVVPPALPIDRVAYRVTSKGEHHAFANRSDEICVPTPLPMRLVPSNMKDFTGAAFGKFTVVGLATIQNNARYLQVDPLNRKATKKSAYRARWVCRCVCGMYALRGAKAISNHLTHKWEWGFSDACYQCRRLDKLKNEETK